MKTHIPTPYLILILFVVCILFASCDDYLDIKPKGKKIPSTLQDFRAFLDNSRVYTSGDESRQYIVNEFAWMNPSALNSYPLVKINYLWLADEDRISLAETNQTYNYNYQGIYYANLTINEVPKLKLSGAAEENEAKELVAQAKVKRAIHYFHLVNTFAKMYDATTASTDGGVPIITTSDDFETVFPQKTVAEVYALIVSDLESSLADLPEKSKSFMQPNKASGYALLARVQLFMKDFDSALANAEKALGLQNFIFDMVAYHQKHIKPGNSIQDNRALFSGLPSITFAEGRDENMLMVYGSSTQALQGLVATSIPMEDPEGNENLVRDLSRFEPGDTRFLCSYYRNTSVKLFEYSRRDNVNTGGIRTTEVYLMRAECYARKGELAKAMEDVNAIRRKRIISYWVPGLPSDFTYRDIAASTAAEAMDIIRHERDVELMGSNMMFYDLRRFNKEAEYKRTLVKIDHDGVKRMLEPDSELWVIPFPKTATLYNSTIKQNTSI